MEWQKIYQDKYIYNIGQGLSELTPVEIVGCEVYEAGSPFGFRQWVVHTKYEWEKVK